MKKYIPFQLKVYTFSVKSTHLFKREGIAFHKTAVFFDENDTTFRTEL